MSKFPDEFNLKLKGYGMDGFIPACTPTSLTAECQSFAKSLMSKATTAT